MGLLVKEMREESMDECKVRCPRMGWLVRV